MVSALHDDADGQLQVGPLDVAAMASAFHDDADGQLLGPLDVESCESVPRSRSHVGNVLKLTCVVVSLTIVAWLAAYVVLLFVFRSRVSSVSAGGMTVRLSAQCDTGDTQTWALPTITIEDVHSPAARRFSVRLHALRVDARLANDSAWAHLAHISGFRTADLVIRPGATPCVEMADAATALELLNVRLAQAAVRSMAGSADNPTVHMACEAEFVLHATIVGLPFWTREIRRFHVCSSSHSDAESSSDDSALVEVEPETDKRVRSVLVQNVTADGVELQLVGSHAARRVRALHRTWLRTAGGGVRRWDVRVDVAGGARALFSLSRVSNERMSFFLEFGTHEDADAARSRTATAHVGGLSVRSAANGTHVSVSAAVEYVPLVRGERGIPVTVSTADARRSAAAFADVDVIDLSRAAVMLEGIVAVEECTPVRDLIGSVRVRGTVQYRLLDGENNDNPGWLHASRIKRIEVSTSDRVAGGLKAEATLDSLGNVTVNMGPCRIRASLDFGDSGGDNVSVVFVESEPVYVNRDEPIRFLVTVHLRGESPVAFARSFVQRWVQGDAIKPFRVFVDVFEPITVAALLNGTQLTWTGGGGVVPDGVAFSQLFRITGVDALTNDDVGGWQYAPSYSNTIDYAGHVIPDLVLHDDVISARLYAPDSQSIGDVRLLMYPSVLGLMNFRQNFDVSCTFSTDVFASGHYEGFESIAAWFVSQLYGGNELQLAYKVNVGGGLDFPVLSLRHQADGPLFRLPTSLALCGGAHANVAVLFAVMNATSVPLPSAEAVARDVTIHPCPGSALRTGIRCDIAPPTQLEASPPLELCSVTDDTIHASMLPSQSLTAKTGWLTRQTRLCREDAGVPAAVSCPNGRDALLRSKSDVVLARRAGFLDLGVRGLEEEQFISVKTIPI